MDFEWDDEKDLSNQHSNQQKHAIGPINRGLVVVVYTEPEEDRVRIVGARLASRREQDLYRAYMDHYT